MITKVSFSQNGIQNKQNTTNNAVLPKQRQHDPSFGNIRIDLKHYKPNEILIWADAIRTVLPQFRINPHTPWNCHEINALNVMSDLLDSFYKEPILNKHLQKRQVIDKWKQGLKAEDELAKILRADPYSKSITTDHAHIRRVLDFII